MIISPQIIVTPDTPMVLFREAKEAFDIEAEVMKVVQRQGWGLGTRFNVHFISHDRTTLLATAEYIVTGEVEDYVTNDVDGYQTMSKTVFRRKCARLGDWTKFDAPKEPDTSIPALQKRMKELTGKGFPPGTSRDDMLAALVIAEGKAA